MKLTQTLALPSTLPHKQLGKICTFQYVMPRKRKSVTFQENVSMIYPKTFDGSFSPPPNTTTLANPTQPLRLDPMYVSWLHSATRVHLPFVLNGTFATHVYRQNFDEHVKPKTVEDVQRAISREAAVPPLAEKYGSLGWGTLYREVSENAWVRNYRVWSLCCASNG